jgi:predicted acetyltransferase
VDADLDVALVHGSHAWHRGRVELVSPAEEYLPSYLAALGRGWSAEHARQDAAAAAAEEAVVLSDPMLFLHEQSDPAGGGRPIVLPNGDEVPRLPGRRLWMWDGEYCGAIALRWQPGTMDLPPYCLGHVGYAVVPWRRRRGYAADALRRLLAIARDEGLPYVDIVTDADNIASQAVALANGAVLMEEFVTPASQGSFAATRYRITLA